LLSTPETTPDHSPLTTPRNRISLCQKEISKDISKEVSKDSESHPAFLTLTTDVSKSLRKSSTDDSQLNIYVV